VHPFRIKKTTRLMSMNLAVLNKFIQWFYWL
jgi:hypothetical protein